jgi:predicted DNA-binding transcriptional regulator YafY
MRTRSISRAEDLATHLEVSRRTVYRDISHLQASGLPIEGAAGVGYLLRPGFDLPNVTFTHDQLDALAIGLAFAERVGDPDMAEAAREVRAKIQAGMPEPEARRLSDAPFFSLHSRKPPHAAVLRGAIRKRRIVEMLYQDGAGVPSRRRVRPLAIWSFADGWMFTGWCELRDDFRTFRFDRIAHLAMTDDRFVQDETNNLAVFLARESCDPVTGLTE